MLAGYASVTLAGEAVDDTLLHLVATATPLRSMHASCAPAVTDAGLSAAAAAATQLTSLSLEGCSATGTRGLCLPEVLALPRLATLKLDTALRDLEDLPPAAMWCACCSQTLPCQLRCLHDQATLWQSSDMAALDQLPQMRGPLRSEAGQSSLQRCHPPPVQRPVALPGKRTSTAVPPEVSACASRKMVRVMWRGQPAVHGSGGRVDAFDG